MRKRTGKLCLCIVYCALALVGLAADFGLFSGRITARPFVYYTSLSNMLCSAFMFAALIHAVRFPDRELWPRCKFVFVVMILLTAIVYNLLLNGYPSWSAYFAAVKNSLYHLILPVLFVLDWIVFYRRGRVKPLDPILALGIPVLYVVYILLRAAIVKWAGISVRVLYPYFFLNVDSLGWGGFARWMGILLAGLLALGYGLFGLDRLLSGRKA